MTNSSRHSRGPGELGTPLAPAPDLVTCDQERGVIFFFVLFLKIELQGGLWIWTADTAKQTVAIDG